MTYERVAPLHDLGIYTVADLIKHLPMRHEKHFGTVSVEEAKSLLESSQGEAKQASENADEIKKAIAEIEQQLQENEKEINEVPEQEKENYIDSYQGRFIILSIFILIIIAMYLLRRRLNRSR